MPALPLQEDRQSVSSVVSPAPPRPGSCRAGAYQAGIAPRPAYSSRFHPGAGAEWGHRAGDPQEPHLGHLQPQVLGKSLGTSGHPALPPSHLAKPPSPSAPPALSSPVPQPPLLRAPAPPAPASPACCALPRAPLPGTAAAPNSGMTRGHDWAHPYLHPAAAPRAPDPGGAEAAVPAGLVPRGHPALRGAGAAELQRGLPGTGEPGQAGVRAQRDVGRAAPALHHPGCRRE